MWILTADPRTIAADLRQSRPRFHPANCTDCQAVADLVEQVVVPLHDAWLKAKPPCSTCGGMNTVHRERPKVGWRGCPDCSDGVLPFDKWTAGLVALWTAVHGDVPPVEADDVSRGVRLAYRELRQIGGAR